jgi:hypothetical protein
MSEHAFVQENIEAYVTGGLDAAEIERVDKHAAECPACTAALNDARRLDGCLEAIFAGARPEPALEDRLIQSVRDMNARQGTGHRWVRSLAWGTAATVAVGLTGAGASRLFNAEGLPSPATSFSARTRAENHLRDLTGLVLDDTASMVRDPEAMAQGIGRGAEAGVRGKENDLSWAFGGDSVRDTGVSLAKEGESRAEMLPSGKDLAPKGWSADGPASYTPPPTDGTSNTIFDSEKALKDPRTEHHIAPAGQREKSRSTQSEGHYYKPSEHRGEPASKSDANQGKAQDKKNDADEKPGGSSAPKPGGDKLNEPAPQSTSPRRIVIRSGEIEFEVESFDSAVATATKLVTAIKGAFVATVNSDKLPNGKVKGALVVRVPPEQLDGLVLDLRKELGKGGELKGLRIGSQDITKQYTDLESRLKGAQTMEQRLLQIIKEGKGEIKQLLEAEKELGIWRTKIEELQGEIRYYANLVALSTLTITLAEKDIRAAAGLVESERVQASIEVDDVDRARQQALEAVVEAKGRVTKSELKQHPGGQYSAVLQFEVAPEAAGPLRDRLRQIGTLVRQEIDRVQRAEGGREPVPGARVKRGDTQFFISLYNLANIAPRETATVQLAVANVPASYRALQEAVARLKGRVVTATLDEQDRQNIKAQLDLEVPRGQEKALETAFAESGEVLTRNVSRAADSENVTNAKLLFKTSLFNAARIPPRETVTLGVEVENVDATVDVLRALVSEAKGRTVGGPQVGHERSGRVTARVIYDVPLSAAPALIDKLRAAGTVRAQQAMPNLQAPEGRLAVARLDVTLSNSDLIVPKDDGLWPQVRQGLATSVRFLSLSASWLIFGVCVILPWAVLAYGGYRLIRWLFRPAPANVSS